MSNVRLSFRTPLVLALLALITGCIGDDEAIIFANAITFVLAASILSFKIYNVIFKKG